MANSYDVIVIGGGHNGMVTAAYLAKAGLKAVVLERRQVLGGVASTEEVFPGFKFDTVAHSSGWLNQSVVRDLDLGRHGLDIVRSNPTVFTPLLDGNRLLLWQETARNVESIRRFSKRDADKWPSFVSLIGRMAGLLEAIESVTMPHVPSPSPSELLSLAGLGGQIQKLSGKDRPEFLRLIPMSIFELLNDWFETDVLKGTLGAAGITGLTQGPRATGTGLLFLHNCVGAPNGVFRANGLVRGGIGSLSNALANAAKGFGAEIRLGAEVAQVIVKDDRAVGVALSTGEELSAKRVVSSVDPRCTFFNLVDPACIGPEFVRDVRNIKMRGSVAKVNLALGELPNFTALSGNGAHPSAELRASLRGTISISPNLDYLERAHDDAKYGRISQKPYLEAVIPSLTDPTRAPEGKHIMSVWVQYAPYRLREGNWAEMKERLGDVVVDTLADYAPNLKNAIIHRQVLTPADLENEYGLTEGNVSHGEMMLEHLFFMRPVGGWAQYRTPIAGLYLCGAGTHPGGGITGRPGHNAAREIMSDVRRAR
ncbi:MAG TPA: NAD(P)/FAD-dependent oxidoreductase [Anaerolineales bacterium]|nr:NAD(P)/FAD-dependent oxidoreductase [Anaerolineales bacterium]